MKRAWSVYIAVLLALALGRMAQKIMTETGGFGSRYGPLILAVILALGVLGAIYEKAFIHRWMWIALFWTLAIASAGLLILAGAQLLEGSYPLGGMILGLLALLAPGGWQLFRYAHRSPRVWGEADASVPPAG